MRKFNMFAAGICVAAAISNYLTEDYMMVAALLLLTYLNISQGLNDAGK